MPAPGAGHQLKARPLPCAPSAALPCRAGNKVFPSFVQLLKASEAEAKEKEAALLEQLQVGAVAWDGLGPGLGPGAGAGA